MGTVAQRLCLGTTTATKVIRMLSRRTNNLPVGIDDGKLALDLIRAVLHTDDPDLFHGKPPL